MPDTRRLRGNVNIALNWLVREGVITGFKTNFDQQGTAATPHVTATVAEEWSLEAVRALIVDALTEVAIGIDVTVERV